MGAMENMKYVAGMLAGSRAMTDGNPKLGYIATFPIPEELRLGNAFALGAAGNLPRMYDGCALDFHLARSDSGERSCFFAVRRWRAGCDDRR